MAINCFNGAEVGSTADLSATSGTVSVVSSPVHSGSYAYRCNPTLTGVGYFLPETYNGVGLVGTSVITASAYVTFYFRYATKPTSGSEDIYSMDSQGGAGDKLFVRINDDGTLAVYDSTNTLVDTGTTALGADTWYKIGVRTGNGTTAAYELQINDSTELSGTCDQRATNNRSPKLGKFANRNGNTVDFYYDDFVRDDSAFQTGTHNISVLMPTGDGATSGWGGGTGAFDWQEVDETPHDSDTTYVESTSTSQKETWALADGSTLGAISSVLAVKSILVAKESAAGTSACQMVFRSNTTENTTSSGDWGASYVVRGKFYATDPATSAAWVTAAIDSIEVGAQRNLGDTNCRITRAAAEVLFIPDAPVGGAYISKMSLMGIG